MREDELREKAFCDCGNQKNVGAAICIGCLKEKCTEKTNAWHWKMDYCRKEGLAPANDMNWKKAEEAYMFWTKGGSLVIR